MNKSNYQIVFLKACHHSFQKELFRKLQALAAFVNYMDPKTRKCSMKRFHDTLQLLYFNLGVSQKELNKLRHRISKQLVRWVYQDNSVSLVDRR